MFGNAGVSASARSCAGTLRSFMIGIIEPRGRRSAARLVANRVPAGGLVTSRTWRATSRAVRPRRTRPRRHRTRALGAPDRAPVAAGTAVAAIGAAVGTTAAGAARDGLVVLHSRVVDDLLLQLGRDLLERDLPRARRTELALIRAGLQVGARGASTYSRREEDCTRCKQGI